MSENLKRTELYEWHLAHGGRMMPFAGWEMPVQYPTGPIKEHHTTRQTAGLFDIDHMAQVEVRGPEAETFLNWVMTYDVRKMRAFDAHYALFCYPDGGTVDDLFIYRLPDPELENHDYFFLAINASNREKDVAWLNAHAGAFDVTVRDIADETYILAFQGPKAPEILNRLTNADLEKVTRFTAVQDTVAGVPMLLGLTGYTGEDGFELYFPAEKAVKVWESILEVGQADGVLPIGLAARDSLRFEPCMPLYGHELTPEIGPVQARLTFAVSFDKDFLGRDALLKQKLEKNTPIQIGFELLERGVPREGYPVIYNEQEVGQVTTGMISPTTERYVGLAYVPREISKIGTEIGIVLRGKTVKAKIINRPFYMPAYQRRLYE